MISVDVGKTFETKMRFSCRDFLIVNNAVAKIVKKIS